jgi:periplasmic copper chaperone A
MNIRTLSTIALLCGTQGTQGAMAHGYLVGQIEITHPAIMVPSANSDCSCAHVRIINHGTSPEYFLGAVISAAARTHLIEISAGGKGIVTPARVEIPPGQTLDLSRHEWCLFMSGISTRLEADMGAIAGHLLFEKAGAISIEFMIDAP